MIHFIEDKGNNEGIAASVDSDATIDKVVEAFVGFLQGVSFGNATIYHGLKNGAVLLEDMMGSDAETFIDEVLKERMAEAIREAVGQ